VAKLKENSTIAKASGEELIATEPKVLSMIQDNAYVHPTSHPASMITQNSSNRFVTDAQISSWNAKWDYSESTIKAVKVNKATDADTVNGKTVGINVPANAKFTDTVYTHPSTHPASMITGLHDSATTGIAGSVAWSNVTGKPSLLALGETSSTAYRGDRGKIAYDHSQSAHAPSNANYYVHPSTHPASMITGLHASATTGVAGSVAWSNVTGKPSTFPPSSHTHSQYELPRGVIVMWSGSIASIPSGWALCDGSNGTPDLRDRFIVGAGGSYNVGNTGGEMTVTLTTAHMPSHNHGATTNSAGGHQHNITIHGTTASANRLIFGYSSGTLNTTDQRSGELLALEGGGNYAIPTVNCDSAGAHSHTVTVNNAGSGIPHENRPPYYALAYIMKL
jgi:microcystin-dependent protein